MTGVQFIQRSFVHLLLMGAALICGVSIGVGADEEPNHAVFAGLNLTGHTLRVTTIVEYPYLTLKNNGESLSGNDRFEGYCKEVLELLANKLGFKYELHLVRDSRFGNVDESGNWDGMIGEILRGEADMGVSSMILTRVRAEVVDFSIAFADFRLAVLVKRSDERPKMERKLVSSFNFLQPLKPSLWVFTFIMSITTLGYYYGLEWAVAHPRRVTDALRRILLMIRRRELIRNASNPPATAQEQIESPELKDGSKAGLITKIALISFLVIMLSAYMANYFTIHHFSQSKGNGNRSKHAESLEELWYQNKLTIVSANPGSTAAYLQKSDNPVHSGIYAKMISQGNHVKSTMQGVDLLREGHGYAFSMEESGAKYIAARYCEFDVLPHVYGPKKSFAIALPQESEFKDAVNQAILHFKETGMLEELESKFRNCDGNRSRTRKKVNRRKRRYTSGLNLSNMAGIFCFLIAAYFLSVILGFGEFWIKKFKFVRKQQGLPLEREAPLASIGEIESSL